MGNVNLFISMKHPPLTPFMKPHNVSHLEINDVCEFYLPVAQSAFTHNPDTTIILVSSKFTLK